MQPIRDVTQALEALAMSRKPGPAMALMIVALVATWFLYVGPHELLHALGCIVTGGTVTRVEMSPIYGAALYAKWFPFVVVGSEYAGQVTGFDKSSDFKYFATDFMPFVLTILLGVPLLKLAGRGPHPILLGMAVVIGLAPFSSLPGDYYEMGSMLTTRAITIWKNGFGQTLVFEHLRSDDVFKLVSEMFAKPAELGLDTPGKIVAGTVVVLVSAIMGLLLALGTYWLGHLFAKYVLRIEPSPAAASTGKPSKNAS